MWNHTWEALTRRSAWIGMILWGGVLLVPPASGGTSSQVAVLLLLAVLVLVPLALERAEPLLPEFRPLATARGLHLPAALLALIACYLPVALPAGLCALGWLLYTALLG